MRIDLGSVQRRSISVGDIIVCEKATYMVAKDETFGVKITFPILCINLETGIKDNAFMNVEQLQTAHEVCSKSGAIITVLEHDEVQLIRLERTHDIVCNLGSIPLEVR